MLKDFRQILKANSFRALCIKLLQICTLSAWFVCFSLPSFALSDQGDVQHKLIFIDQQSEKERARDILKGGRVRFSFSLCSYKNFSIGLCVTQIHSDEGIHAITLMLSFNPSASCWLCVWGLPPSQTAHSYSTFLLLHHLRVWRKDLRETGRVPKNDRQLFLSCGRVQSRANRDALDFILPQISYIRSEAANPKAWAQIIGDGVISPFYTPRF